ncbi:MAG: CBS domain-containing protein [Myxococcota bacterium]
MRVEDVMSKFVIAAAPTTSLRAGMEVMDREDIRHLPIIDEDGVLGVLGRRYLQNLVTIASGRQEYEDLLEQSVESFLATRFTKARDVVVARPKQSLRDAIDLLLEHKLSALPVVDDENEIVGILSYVDVLEELKGFAV